MRFATALVAVALAASAFGCGGPQTAREKLTDATFAYNDGIRWKRFDLAARQLPPERRQGWVQAMERLSRTMEIVDYELVPIRIGDDEAIFDVAVAYYQAPAVTLEQARRRQTWRYVDSTWHLVGDEEAPEVPVEEEPASWPGWAPPRAAAE